MGRTAHRDYGESVKIYDRTRHAIAVLADWYGVTQRRLLDALILDRLEGVMTRLADDLRDFWQRPRGARGAARDFESMVRELFGLRPGQPVPRSGKGRGELAASPVRISKDTHRGMCTLAEWYDRFMPHVYAALIADRLEKLGRRMMAEAAGRVSREGFAAAVRDALGIEVDAGDDDGDQGRSVEGSDTE